MSFTPASSEVIKDLVEHYLNVLSIPEKFISVSKIA